MGDTDRGVWGRGGGEWRFDGLYGTVSSGRGTISVRIVAMGVGKGEKGRSGATVKSEAIDGWGAVLGAGAGGTTAS